MNKKICFLPAVLLFLFFVLTGCGKKPEPQPEQTAAQPVNVQGEAGSGVPEEGSKVRLEDDYYGFVNRYILEETKIPEDSNSWSYFYKLDKEAYEVLHEVLQEAVENRQKSAPGSLEQKIADMYLTAMDMEGRRNAGLGALQPYIDEIRNASGIKEYLESVGKLYSDLGHGSIITAQWLEDMSDSSRYALYVDGADLGPGKETLEDETQAALLSQYQAYIGKIMESAGLDQEEAAQAASGILGLQKELAASALPLSDQSNPDVIYNPYSAEEIKSLFPNEDIDGFFEAAGLTGVPFYVVTQEGQMKKISRYLTEDHLPLLKNYSIFCLINDFGPYLTPEIRDSYLDWYNVQKGIKEKKTDEKMASEMTQDILGFEFGRLYVEKCFTEGDKLAIEDMVHQILGAYKKQIMGLDWMGEETKAAAVKKLDSMTLKIGYPDKWPDDYAQASVLPAESGGSFIDNTISLLKAKNRVDRDKVRKPVDKSEWGMTPQTVNAYYNPTGNEIVFPAALLQAPFYDSEADFAANLGGIGMVIAHEVSHAFDSSGSLYDENGNYHVWWTDEDRAKFKKLADQVVAYYNGQEGYEGRRVNGAQTLNENIADLGSMNCITSIVGDDVDDLKLLFVQYATIWASKYTPESMIQRLNTDVHSPARVRVNAVLSATDAFYKAYPEIKEGDAMYTAQEKRVKIW
ncbi:M13 family metallopeptidase [Clostridium sp. Marseille-P2415]|uniref:M13 family metallopeptidase n=1 Tax=Clostridium sp. Marseille-P2415 TaxID=1805471 RepID=UPI00098885FB|nr:M13 family metallopeptidase [Clostridium sp. Marseille-P2415]